MLFSSLTSNDKDIEDFQEKNKKIIPHDLADFFRLLNGSNDEYDNLFFRFYPLANFKSIDDELRYYSGIPDYTDIINSLEDYESYFVFADFTFMMFAYAIKLHPNLTKGNPVIGICGSEYKVIANSFSEFIQLYLDNSYELQL